MKCHILLNRNSNTIVRDDVYSVEVDFRVFKLIGYQSQVLAFYPIDAVTSIEFAD